jgi:hypothetical protein
MDEPSSIAGGDHRHFRHDISSIPVAIQMFGQKYGAEMVENIFLDHLKADSEEDRVTNRAMMTAPKPYLDERLTTNLKVLYYKRAKRVAKVSWSLRKGWEIHMTINVSGGKNDVKIDGIESISQIIGTEKMYFVTSGRFRISNRMSVWTDKIVNISYQVRCGMAYGPTLETRIVI